MSRWDSNKLIRHKIAIICPFVHSPIRLFAHWGIALSLLLLFLLTTACQRSPNHVMIVVDEEVYADVLTYASTVRDLLNEENIALGELDRVEPDLYVSIKPEMTIQVIRVEEITESEINVIPFARRTVVNEALPIGEQRLAQLGVNGEEEIVTKVTLEDGIEVNRTEVSRTILQQPVEEVVVVGGEGSLPTINFKGIIAYLSGGNVWLMKDNNSSRRALTTSGDLDGRVFSLSPDGGQLLYSRVVTDVVDAPLNEVWLVNTIIVGEDPISLPLKGILYADWMPSISPTLIAYSTGERVLSQPGWRANNDLWLWDTSTEIAEAVELIPANTQGVYSWWGTNFVISPDGEQVAYAKANEIGVIDLISITTVASTSVTPLLTFAPFETNSEWVWVPALSWSPDNQFIATTLYGSPHAPFETATADPEATFDLWFIKTDNTLKAKIWPQAGMWSNPVWYTDGVIFGRTNIPHRVDDRYKLATVDRDGSNAQLLFPLGAEIGIQYPEIVWLSTGNQAVFTYQNNLYLLNQGLETLHQLTSDNQSHHPVWGLISSSLNIESTLPLSNSTTLTQTTNLTISKSVSTSLIITP